VRGRVILWSAAAAAMLAGLIAAGAYLLPKYLLARAGRIAAQQELVRGVVDHCRDQFLRHPDYNLAAEYLFLVSFEGAPLKEQLRNLDELREFSRQLESRLLASDAGLRPGDPLWSEAARFKTYSAGGFKRVSDATGYREAMALSEAPPITGNREADERIVSLAMQRGYRLRPVAVEERLVTEGVHRLQAPALAAWRELQAAAREEGIRLELVSAYRSVDRQRDIFLSELGALGLRDKGGRYSPEEIASGAADRQIEEVLRYSSIPGFSKHHSGYAMDISDPAGGRVFTDFAQTQGFTWISAHNYLNAKRFGFIPSYPAGGGAQGPEPEPWEYVWVGRERLLNTPMTE
jgi:D-alanyl-D-alanine carboxypeptidase